MEIKKKMTPANGKEWRNLTTKTQKKIENEFVEHYKKIIGEIRQEEQQDVSKRLSIKLESMEK